MKTLTCRELGYRRDPLLDSRDPLLNSRDLLVDSRDPLVDSRDPLADLPGLKVDRQGVRHIHTTREKSRICPEKKLREIKNF